MSGRVAEVEKQKIAINLCLSNFIDLKDMPGFSLKDFLESNEILSFYFDVYIISGVVIEPAFCVEVSTQVPGIPTPTTGYLMVLCSALSADDWKYLLEKFDPSLFVKEYQKARDRLKEKKPVKSVSILEYEKALPKEIRLLLEI